MKCDFYPDRFGLYIVDDIVIIYVKTFWFASS